MSRNFLILVLIFLVCFDIFVWQKILTDPGNDLSFYFFKVGQGDSELIILENNVKILIDGGPNKSVLKRLNEVLPFYDNHLDLVILSHPQYDHFAGLIDVLKRYQIGLFIFNGRERNISSFKELKKVIKEKNIKTLALAKGDKISYLDNQLIVLSPTKELLKGNFNDGSLVILFKNKKIKALFTGDISSKTEKKILKYLDQVDILKVAHHGSKYSSSFQFLKTIEPKLAIIEVGKNPYGHPSKEAVSRLKSLGALVFSTLNNSLLIKIKETIKIFQMSH